MFNKFLDYISSISPWAWLRVGFLVLLQTCQFLVIIGFILTFFPFRPHGVLTLLHQLNDATPQRSPQLYMLGILFFNGLFFLIALQEYKNVLKGIGVLQKPMANSHAQIYGAILVEGIILILLLVGLDIKGLPDCTGVLIHQNMLFLVGILLMGISKFLLKDVGAHCISPSRLGAGNIPLIEQPFKKEQNVFTGRWACLLIFVSIFCILGFYIPDTKALFDAVYFYGRLTQSGLFLWNQAYMWFSGLLPGIDGACWYGVGLPIVLGQICKLTGSFDMIMLYKIVLWLIIIYTIVWFVIYTRAFRSPLLALAAWFFFLKFYLLFSLEKGALLTFVNLFASPIRLYGDVFFLAAICAHWSSKRMAWLLVAGFICAIQVFLFLCPGPILVFMLGIYLLLLITVHLRNRISCSGIIRDALLVIVLSVALYGSIMFYIYGSQMWHVAQYDVMDAVNDGLGTGNNLANFFQDRTAFFSDFSFIFLCILSIWPAAGLTLKRGFGDIRPMLLVVVSFYGLAQHLHFEYLADPGTLGRDNITKIFIIFLWYDVLIEGLPRFLKLRLSAILLFVAILLLFNEQKWKDYPNFFHPNARYFNVDNSSLKDYFDRAYAFKEEVELIQKYTSAQEPLALVSEHHLMILIKSHRKPFFSDFYMVRSEHIERTSYFPIDDLNLAKELRRTLDEIKSKNSPVIFVERKLFLIPPRLPFPSFKAADIPLVQVVNEVLKYYEPVDGTPFLVALKLRHVLDKN